MFFKRLSGLVAASLVLFSVAASRPSLAQGTVSTPASTPDGTLTSTPASTMASTPAGTLTSTPASTPAGTPASTPAGTPSGNSVELQGMIQSITGTTVVINGKTIDISQLSSTLQLKVGDTIKVEGTLGSNGQIVARELKQGANETENELEDDHSIGGLLNPPAQPGQPAQPTQSASNNNSGRSDDRRDDNKSSEDDHKSGNDDHGGDKKDSGKKDK